jgi:cytochrome c5
MRTILLVSAFVAALGCNGSGATGATCPTTNTLTYENFGRAFFASYCDRCHANGIRPSLGNQAAIQAQRTAIDLEAAAGPNGVNTTMPEGSPAPSDAERQKLGVWLACGAR